MEHALWKGRISFGLVEIPVRLWPAVKANELSFSLLDRRDFSPVGNKRYNKETGKEVPWDDVVRGFEYEPDEYVVLSDEELRRANVAAHETIEIMEFVDQSEIDPMYYEMPYYVTPLQKGSKSYALLRDALERSGRVGIARVVLRTRQRLAALLVRNRVLVLDLLRYAHELRGADEVAEPPKSAKGSVTAAEIKMAQELIHGMNGTWNPARFKDEYRDDVMALVRRKVKAGQIHTIVEPSSKEEPAARSEVMDLMPLLRRSLAAHEAAGRRSTKKNRARSSTGRRHPRSA